MKTSRTSVRYVVPTLLALAWHGHVSAQELSQPDAASSVPAQHTGYVDLMGGLGYTDNALLTGSQRTSDGIGTLGFDVDYARAGNLSLNLLGNLDRVEYLDHSYAGSFYGQFTGSGILGKSSDPVQWQLSDGFGEEQTDPLASPTPQNLQTINDISTGPLVNLHFGPSNRLTLSGLYSRTTYERSPFDSQTYQGGVEFLHAISGASSVSLDASSAHTEYLQSAAVQSYLAGSSSGYDIRQASLSYQATLLRADVLLRAGYNVIQYGGASSHGDPLYEFRVSRQVSPFSTIFLDGQQVYSSNGASLASPGTQVALQVGASVNPGYAVAQPFNQRSLDAGWLFQRARTNLSLTGTYQEHVFDQTSVTNGNNYREEGVTVAIGRQLRPKLSVQLQAQGYWDRYPQFSAQTRRESFRLTLSKRFARTMAWFYVERLHQGGSPGNSSFEAGSYNDDRVGLYVTYDLLGERSMQPTVEGVPGEGGFSGGY